MNQQQGFLIHDPERGRYFLDVRETLSMAVGEVLLSELLKSRPFMCGNLLDVGCGRRPYRLIYDSLVDQSIGTEVAYSYHSVDAADVINFAENLPFATGSFDTVLCTEVLEHTEQPFLAMSEFARVLKVGGHLILSVPFYYPIHEAPYDYWRFTRHGLENLCRSTGFRPVYIHPKLGLDLVLVSSSLAVTVRILNAVSIALHLEKSLRDNPLLRSLLASIQRVYLLAAESLGRPSWISKHDEWMTAGYVMVAQRYKA